jgi:tripartite-type tricarboxylate transporter receptor subunit TctC
MFSGQLHMSLLSVASVFGHVRAGRLRALAIATEKRAKIAPEIPTMIEAGVPGYKVTQWHGLLAPRGTPRAILDRVQGGVVKALQHPDVATRLAADGTEPVGSTPAQFAAHLRFEHDTWSKVAKQTGLRVD